MTVSRGELLKLPLGLYQIKWSTGGTSSAAVYQDATGMRWIAPSNWLSPAPIHHAVGDIVGIRAVSLETPGKKGDTERSPGKATSPASPSLGARLSEARDLERIADAIQLFAKEVRAGRLVRKTGQLRVTLEDQLRTIGLDGMVGKAPSNVGVTATVAGSLVLETPS